MGLNACYYDKADKLKLTTGNCDTLNVTFSTNVNPVMTQHCLSCHNTAGASGGISLDGYANIKSAAANPKFLSSMKHESGASPMPKSMPKLDACLISKIERWILNGMPNN
jgi:S-formylglutathione hydrolase FrmB